ncbi:homeobox protein BEL1 homolog [Abrus precatorius]|uniref:Homeobox protein BEL1 homolog n=1 Tax=Abrus precatorius TaxID=3816 RepID=A0A8B8LVB2_ABRPR|nr:homeobox protein BEL1 homolog [Abrus precatorius]XP_027359686.1 homeobox protein BEL1 homolog [Abrus precatorius]XP_027359687.1 homeobox protein BEL1 homolog [Abrus precatorius]XP_027359688.1 homeobox protein BEL1 homolog [Abrus precatorius]XP_027359689.1 homeobox protein BEL1 homolog [Abrus precatorius]
MARQLCEDKSSGGFCYSDASSGNPTMQTHLVNQIQGFVSDPEMFNLTTGMEMIGFPKGDANAVMWKTFSAKPGPSSSKTMNHSSTTFYHHDYNNKPSDFTQAISETSGENLIVGAHDSAPWQENNNRLLVDDSSLRCVFPCEGNERPSQGLSLSLSSTNPSTIGLQSFELRQTSHHPDFVSTSREGFFGKSVTVQQQQVLQDGYLSAKPANLYQQGHFLLKNSKYLVPAQDLLNEFCSLGTKQSEVPKPKSSNKNKQWEEDNNNGVGSSKKHSLTSLEFVELQKRKTKLLSMLEEVDRRYKHYRNQMKSVVSSFEAVAGNGAATVYSALALKAMSRHFRCLKDGILGQIQATRKAMGEKDPVAPGTTRGETPRLKIIDQALRQQRAFQQMSMMETHPWRPQRGLPERSVSVLRAWLFEHFLHPYPSDVDKHILARQTGLSRSQVSNWFINARVRLWKPMVEEMYLEELKDQENNIASSEAGTDPDDNINPNVQNPPPASSRSEDQKPTLVRIDSECASSVINNHTPDNKNDPKNSTNMNPQEQCFGSVELDFSSYTHHTSGMVSYSSNDHDGNNQSLNGGNGVSLTLGLQQHGVSLAFPPTTQSSLYYPRDQIEDCQPVQYSLLDGEGQNLPYRNLMGAQLLHDLAG